MPRAVQILLGSNGRQDGGITPATWQRLRVYLLLAACLFPELGYPGVWRKLTAGLEGLAVAAPTPSALNSAP